MERMNWWADAVDEIEEDNGEDDPETVDDDDDDDAPRLVGENEKRRVSWLSWAFSWATREIKSADERTPELELQIDASNKLIASQNKKWTNKNAKVNKKI